jgi:hypothetical protein
MSAVGRPASISHHPLGSVDSDDERRCDREILAGSNAPEVDERRSELEGGDHRAVISLRMAQRLARTRLWIAKPIRETTRRLVELILVGCGPPRLRRRCDQAQGPAVPALLRAEDPGVERTKAHALPTGDEPTAENINGNEICVLMLELPRTRGRGTPKLDIDLSVHRHTRVGILLVARPPQVVTHWRVDFPATSCVAGAEFETCDLRFMSCKKPF